MRKIGMVVAMLALVLVVAVPAFAVNKQCGKRPCEGTNTSDTLFERGGNGVNDVINGLRGDDRINTQSFTNDADRLNGGGGADNLEARDGDGFDTLNGERGVDTCSGDTGDEFISCETIFIDGVEQVPAP